MSVPEKPTASSEEASQNLTGGPPPVTITTNGASSEGAGNGILERSDLHAARDLATLQRVPLFEGLADEDLEQIRELMDAHHFAPGQVIIREGEIGDDFYVTVSGNTRCLVLDAGGNEIILDESGPGAFFGELSMLTGEPRSARIVALNQVTTLVLDRDEFFHFLREHPAVAVNILVVLGKRLHRTDSLLARTVSRNVNEIAEDELSWGQRLAEDLATLSGQLPFLVLNFLFAGFWIVWNHPQYGGYDFDPYPYGLLGFIFGFEALLFSILVLNTQARQEAKDRIAEEVHHEINKKSELEIGLILRRLDDIERSTHYSNDEQLRLLEKLAQELPDGDGGREVRSGRK